MLVLAIVTVAQGSMGAASWQRSPVGFVFDSLIPVTPLPDSIPTDTLLPQGVETLPDDSLRNEREYLQNLDSIRQQFDAERGGDGKPVAGERARRGQVQWNDSVAQVEDSLQKHKKKSALDDPVAYEAKDSIVFMMGRNRAYLFGDSKVEYQNITLTAERIEMSLDSSLVYANGAADSTGVLKGKPVFKQGGDEYESETMSYNFDTQKGFITNVSTEQEEGFLWSEESKKGQNKELYLRHGRYTTCDEEHPHFYIALSRAKAYTGKSIFTGPAWLVVEDVPTPIVIPFAYFPFSKKYSSGFIMPSYGDENTRGFYLRDGGYYFAASDKWDLKLTGEIFTKGSWGLGAQTTYKNRYKYSGNFYFNYQVTKTGEENMPDYSVAKNFKLQWSHRQDPKANPNSTFSASVNFATQSYEKNNMTSLYNPTSYSQSTRTSSVSYSRSFPKLGLSLAASMNISQNMRDSVIAMTLPNLTISVQRFYPFRRKKKAGKERWYEKISMNYTGALSNSISTKEDQLLKSNLIKDWKNGMRHTVPIQASFQLLKYLNVVPSFNYTERWYTNRVEQDWDVQKQQVVRDTIYGFNRVYNYNLALQMNTKVYGFFKPNPKVFGKKIEMVRHVFTPSVSFTYAPDFGASRYGYYKTYTKTDADGNVSLVEYSPFSGSLYGTPGKGKTGSVTFDIDNNIEMKIHDRNDSIRKVSIIDQLGASLSYNMAAKTQPWSNLSTRLRLKWGKFTFNMNTVWQTYAYEFDENGNVVVGNRTEWSYGRWGRFQGMSKNLSYTLNNQTWQKWRSAFNKLLGRSQREDEDDENGNQSNQESGDEQLSLETNTEDNGLDQDGYMKFTMPWSLSLSYGITMSEDRSRPINVRTMRYPYKFIHNFNLSGTLKLSEGWNVSFASGYDFTNHAISMTTVNISRDMHCFNISGGMVFGVYTSYYVTLRANASTLTDALKYDKKSSYSSSVQWY